MTRCCSLPVAALRLIQINGSDRLFGLFGGRIVGNRKSVPDDRGSWLANPIRSVSLDVTLAYVKRQGRRVGRSARARQ